MKEIGLCDITGYGFSEVWKEHRVEIKGCEMVKIDKDESDALDSYLKYLASEEMFAPTILPWKTLIMRSIKVTVFGPETGFKRLNEKTIDWPLLRDMAGKILASSILDRNYPLAVSIPGKGFLSTTGEWMLKIRANDVVLTKLIQVDADAKVSSNVERVGKQLRKVAESDLVDLVSASVAVGDKFHCHLGSLSAKDMLYLAESIELRK